MIVDYGIIRDMKFSVRIHVCYLFPKRSGKGN